MYIPTTRESLQPIVWLHHYFGSLGITPIRASHALPGRFSDRLWLFPAPPNIDFSISVGFHPPLDPSSSLKCAEQGPREYLKAREQRRSRGVHTEDKFVHCERFHHPFLSLYHDSSALTFPFTGERLVLGVAERPAPTISAVRQACNLTCAWYP